MLRMRLRYLGFSEVSFGSFLVVIFKAQFWFILARFWLKKYGPILPHFTVLIFVRDSAYYFLVIFCVDEFVVGEFTGYPTKGALFKALGLRPKRLYLEY